MGTCFEFRGYAIDFQSDRTIPFHLNGYRALPRRCVQMIGYKYITRTRKQGGAVNSVEVDRMGWRARSVIDGEQLVRTFQNWQSGV